MLAKFHSQLRGGTQLSTVLGIPDGTGETKNTAAIFEGDTHITRDLGTSHCVSAGEIIACEQALVWLLCARCETRVAKPQDERRSRESVGRGGRDWAKREPAPITVNFSFPPRKL